MIVLVVDMNPLKKSFAKCFAETVVGLSANLGIADMAQKRIKSLISAMGGAGTPALNHLSSTSTEVGSARPHASDSDCNCWKRHLKESESMNSGTGKEGRDCTLYSAEERFHGFLLTLADK